MTKRSSLFIDRLVLSIPVSASEQQLISDRIPTADSEWGGYLSPPRRRGAYRENFRLSLSDSISNQAPWDSEILESTGNTRIASQLGAKAYISLNPWQDRVRYLRIEFSPYAAGAHGRRRMRAFLDVILGTHCDALLRQVIVTRLDVGFDVYRLSVKDILVARGAVRGRQTNGARLFVGEDGELETVYTPLSGTRYLVIYDKTKELNKKRRRRAQEEGTDYVPLASARTRIEYRWHALNLPWAHVGQHLNNAFAQFTVRQFQRSASTGPAHEERLLFDASRTRRFEALLDEIREGTRTDILLRREELRIANRQYPVPAWWNPDDFWTELPQALEETGLLPAPEADPWAEEDTPTNQRRRRRGSPA